VLRLQRALLHPVLQPRVLHPVLHMGLHLQRALHLMALHLEEDQQDQMQDHLGRRDLNTRLKWRYQGWKHSRQRLIDLVLQEQDQVEDHDVQKPKLNRLYRLWRPMLADRLGKLGLAELLDMEHRPGEH